MAVLAQLGVQAEVVAPGPGVALDGGLALARQSGQAAQLGQDAGLRGRAVGRRGAHRQAAVGDGRGQRGLELLVAHAGAEREALVDLEGHARVDVVGLDLGLGGVEAAHPGRVPLGLEAEGRVQAQAQPQALAGLPGEVGVGDGRPAAGVAAGAAQLGGDRRGRVGGQERARGAGVGELRADADVLERDDHLGPLDAGHVGGVEEHRRGVLHGGGLAGVGVAEAAAVLLDQLEAGTEGRGRAEHGQAEDGRERDRTSKSAVSHEIGPP